MVHRGLGSARITYPTTVQLSPADPMTSASLPPRLLAVPGVVSRPIRIGQNAMPTTQQLIKTYLAQAGGDPLIAFGEASAARKADPQNLELRNAEHALFSYSLKDLLGPRVGTVAVLATPAYPIAKAIGQPMGFFKGATPPSPREIRYGLLPLQPRTITQYMTVGVWPGAVLSTAPQCAAYLASHGGSPGSGCKPIYSDGTSGPVIPFAAPPPPSPVSKSSEVLQAPLKIHPLARPGYKAKGLSYYPNLGQYGDAAGATGGGIPTWVWWVAGYGALALLLGGFFYGTPARRQPSVRTVTRTTY